MILGHPPKRVAKLLNWTTVKFGFLIPVVLILVSMVLFWAWYRRKMDGMSSEIGDRADPSARLSAERLKLLATPPWRVVYEINSKLGGIDHVVIGPNGVVAIETIMGDRPTIDPEQATDPQRVASAAIARSSVDELTSRVGVPCQLHAKVYWGAPQAELPAAIPVTHGQVAVTGQRLQEWLIGRPPGTLTQAQVDLVWQSVITGIGRPDPLA